MSNIDDDSDFFRRTWTVLDSYQAATPRHLTRHHLDSFDVFIQEGIRNTIQSMAIVIVKRKTTNIAPHDKDTRIEIFVGGRATDRIYLDRPTIIDSQAPTNKATTIATRPLLPNEARLRGLTYASNLYADIVVEYSAEGESLGIREFPMVKIGVIPIMLQSTMCSLHTLPATSLLDVGECRHDMGGYFIVQGREKVVVAQELPPVNRMFFTKVNDTRKSNISSITTSAYIRCVAPKNSTFPKVVQFDAHKNGRITCHIPYVTSAKKRAFIPLFVLFRVLGVESDRDILEHIMLGEPSDPNLEMFLRPSIVHAGNEGIYDQRSAIESLVKGTTFGSNESLQLVLRDDLFPNAGSSLHDKALMLGDLVRRFVRVCIGATPAPDRDHFSNRRFHVSGELFSSLFRDKYLLFQRNAMSELDKEWFLGPWKHSNNISSLVNDSNLKRLFRSDLIEEGLMSSLKGAWNVDTGADSGHERDNAIDGVAQDLNRVSYMAYVSHIRRLNHVVPGGEQAKQVEPHFLHPSQFGYVCPIDSPDGPRIGLQKHLSVMCHVTVRHDIDPLLEHLRAVKFLIDIANFRGRLSELRGASRVFANELWVGMTFHPDQLTSYVRMLRRANVQGVGVTTSIVWHRYEGEIRILSDAGRCCRPLYLMKHGQSDPTIGVTGASRTWKQWIGPNDDGHDRRKALKDLKWHEKDLTLSWGMPQTNADWQSAVTSLTSPKCQAEIELLDVEECSNTVIAMTPVDAARRNNVRFTHCEVHPGSSLSAVSATFPLLHHQNGGYTYLALAQTKQAIGWYATSFASRMDTIASVLHYPQVPLVTTGFANWLAEGKHAHGENLVVAIASHTGYNQDDGVLLNADAVARGMFHLTSYKTRQYAEEGSEMGTGNHVVFANPLTLEANGLSVDFSGKYGKYDALDGDGFPVPGTSLHEEDMVLGRVSITVEESTEIGGVDKVVRERMSRQVRKDVSDQIARGEAGVVDHVYVTGEPGSRKAKISLRSARVPELGDKVASRFAQKGVVGMMLPACDMPFCHASGIVPDVIFNPHAFPKRMSVPHLLESLLAKTAAMVGTRVRADTFERTDTSSAGELLQTRYGMNSIGDELMYNGRTGEQMQCAIFVGINQVGRLKHLVVDKMNYRATGPVASLTHQATKGRKDKGGLRIGEMEQATLVAHGAASTLKESFMERSDGAQANGVDSAALDVDTRNGKPCLISNSKEGVLRCVDEASGHRATSRVRIPYAAKLLIHELNAMSVDVRVEPQSNHVASSTNDNDEDWCSMDSGSEEN